MEYSKIGIKREEREFKPHITLCRNPKFNKQKFIKIMTQKEAINIGTFKAKEVVLFKSELTEKGPIYRPIKKFNMN